MRRRIIISADVPPEINDHNLADYLIEAIEYWGGQYHPDDPLFYGVNIRTVSMRKVQYKNEESKTIIIKGAN
jgi:hypothetical protein